MMFGHPSNAVQLIAVTFATVCLAAACSGTGGGPEGSDGCTEGRSLQCTCSNGKSGAQTCRADGTWSECTCDGSTSPNDTGTATDTGVADTSMAPDVSDTKTSGDANPSDTTDTGPSPDTGAEDTGPPADTPSPDEYRTVKVPAGEKKHFDVGPGETLENLLVDVTADGAGVFFDVESGTLRNIGIKGENVAEDTLAHVSAPEPDEEVLIENVYAGDGTDAGEGEAGGFWVDATDDDAHRGVATFRNVHVGGFNDNGIYGSGPGVQIGVDEGGEVHIESSYGYNNNISNFRIGTNGSYVKDSVAVVPAGKDVPRHPNGRNARGVRAIEGATEMLVEGCELYVPDWAAIQVKGHATIRDTSVEGAITGDVTTENVDHDVDKTPPPGVPMSAKEAAQGL